MGRSSDRCILVTFPVQTLALQDFVSGGPQAKEAWRAWYFNACTLRSAGLKMTSGVRKRSTLWTIRVILWQKSKIRIVLWRFYHKCGPIQPRGTGGSVVHPVTSCSGFKTEKKEESDDPLTCRFRLHSGLSRLTQCEISNLQLFQPTRTVQSGKSRSSSAGHFGWVNSSGHVRWKRKERIHWDPLPIWHWLVVSVQTCADGANLFFRSTAAKWLENCSDCMSMSLSRFVFLFPWFYDITTFLCRDFPICPFTTNKCQQRKRNRCAHVVE